MLNYVYILNFFEEVDMKKKMKKKVCKIKKDIEHGYTILI